ncbi:MAG TPA: ABC transporter permease [Gaiellaceae bacterium]|nr:ABC transporter permease [Gaiellaceae bacterium]
MTAAPESLIRAGTVLSWHARTYRRTWRATVTVALLNPLFFLFSIGVLLGGLVDDRTANLGGLSYLEFVAPGLLAATAMQIGTNEGSFPVMAGLKWTRTYHAVVATPVRVAELFLGFFGWVALRILVAACIFTAVSAAIGAFRSPWAALAPVAALLCGLAFAAPIAATASAIENSAVLTGVFRFGILPLFLFSGTFFPISQLPAALEWTARATPLWHGVTLCRELAAGTVELWPALGHAAYLSAFTVTGAVIAVRILQRRLLQ